MMEGITSSSLTATGSGIEEAVEKWLRDLAFNQEEVGFGVPESK
jgi:hypothetical protein